MLGNEASGSDELVLGFEFSPTEEGHIVCTVQYLKESESYEMGRKMHTTMFSSGLNDHIEEMVVDLNERVMQLVVDAEEAMRRRPASVPSRKNPPAEDDDEDDDDPEDEE